MKKEFILKMLMLGIMIFCCLYAQEEKECKKDQKLVIVDLISGGSAEKVGIKPGDVIVTYNSKEVHCLQKLQMLKEKVETDSVEITINRDEKLMSFTIPKGMIGVHVKDVLPEIKFENDATVISGIGSLSWDTGEYNSFMGALTRIAEYHGIKKDYTYLMGTSGAAFRILFHEDWCPSSPDPTCGFDCGTVAAKSINLKFQSMSYNKENDNKKEMLEKIIKAIDEKMPVIAIDLIETPEWGLIVGYQKNSEELIVRTYFDKREGYDIAEKFPWLIFTVSKGDGKIDDSNNFKNSLKVAQGLYETEKYEKYYSGTAAIEYWIKRLKEDKFDSLDKKTFEDVMLANAWIFDRLADDRMSAVKYLESFAAKFPQAEENIKKLALIYKEENKLMTESGKITFYPSEMKNRDDWTDEMRLKEIDVLTEVFGKEGEAYLTIKEINKKIKN